MAIRCPGCRTFAALELEGDIDSEGLQPNDGILNLTIRITGTHDNCGEELAEGEEEVELDVDGLIEHCEEGGCPKHSGDMDDDDFTLDVQIDGAYKTRKGRYGVTFSSCKVTCNHCKETFEGPDYYEGIDVESTV